MKSGKFFHIFLLAFLLKTCQVSTQDPNYPKLEFLQKQQDCGRLEIDQSDIRTFAPWAVAIFRRVAKDKWEFHTTGTIFGNRFVYSVQVGPIGKFPSDKNPRNFFIVAGVNTTDFKQHDQHAQYSKVILVKPFYSEFSSYSHAVMYHLEKPLVETPYVKEICFPFFGNNIRFSTGFFNAIKNAVRLEYVQYGFARSQQEYQSQKYRNTSTSKNTNERKEDSTVRTLKVFKGITMRPETCESIFRFYYGKTTFRPICGVRNKNERGGLLPWAGRLDRLKIPNQDDEDLDLMCHGTGSAIMLAFGNLWFGGHPARTVPGERKMRCNEKTVYFSRAYEISQVEPYARWMYNVFRCEADNFSCKDYSRCVPLSLLCDQKMDCDDNSDEDPVLCDWKLKNTLSNETIQFYASKPSRKSDAVYREISGRQLNKCPSLQFPTEGVRCRALVTFDPSLTLKQNSEDANLQQVDCESNFYAEDQVFVDCAEFYAAPRFSFESLNLHCNENGHWIGLEPSSIVCQKQCGIYELRKNDEDLGFPWNVAIFYSGTQLCGGTLIQDNFILTHARCVKNWIENLRKRSLYEIVIRPLSSDYESNFYSNIPVKTQISEVWISVNNLPNKYESGIALVKLRTRVSTNQINRPIAACFLIPPFSRVTPGQSLVGSKLRSETSTTLNLNFTIVPDSECQASRSLVEKNEFCATYFQNSDKDEKNEIPLPLGMGIGIGVKSQIGASQEKNTHTLLGLYSARTNGRAIFMEINAFSDWILDILEQHS